MRLVKRDITRLEQENARLRASHSGSVTDDDSNLEKLSLRVSGKRVSKLEKVLSSQTNLKPNLNSSNRKMVDCGKRLKM